MIPEEMLLHIIQHFEDYTTETHNEYMPVIASEIHALDEPKIITEEIEFSNFHNKVTSNKHAIPCFHYSHFRTAFDRITELDIEWKPRNFRCECSLDTSFPILVMDKCH